MGQGALVREEIDAGREFITRLDRALPVKAAFWLQDDESGGWRLYVVSAKIVPGAAMDYYEEKRRVLQEMDDPNLVSSDVALLGVEDRRAQAAHAIYQQHKGKPPVRIKEGSFGGSSVAAGYLYPPLPQGADQRWRSVSVLVFPETQPEGAYRVEFWPQELQVPVGWGGQPRRVPRPAGVRVEGGRVTEYLPPEKPLADLTENDYERKALEAVKEVAGKCD